MTVPAALLESTDAGVIARPLTVQTELPLRHYLLGDPPIGSAIDVFVYVWATLLTFLGLMLVTVEWMRRRWPTQGDELVVDEVPGDDIGETPT